MTDAETAFALLEQGNAARRSGFDVPARRAVLADLARAVKAHEADIIAALRMDLGKPATETRLTEILPVLMEIRHARAGLSRWARPRKVRATLALAGTVARIVPEPKGTVLIIAPWNYPLGLSLGPLVSAIAAGNAAVVKPSELAAATAAILRTIVSALPPGLVALVEGGADVARALTAQPFDHIFFTGSPTTGAQVMAAAAPNLTPVTLELGGKSPVILGPDADLAKAAQMIVWGKFANAGQTCIAPDHIHVPRAREADLLAALRAEITRAFGPDPKASPSYARIVNGAHFARLTALIDDARAQGAQIEGGTLDPNTCYLAPTLITGTHPGMKIAQDEIFGPVLPILPYDDLDVLEATLAAGPKPLALYIFARDRTLITRLSRLGAGAVSVNLTLAHYLHSGLPFGGIGRSGMGQAHGIWGFRTFSHEKPVIENRFAPFRLLMPPYTRARARLARLTLRLLG